MQTSPPNQNPHASLLNLADRSPNLWHLATAVLASVLLFLLATLFGMRLLELILVILFRVDVIISEDVECFFRGWPFLLVVALVALLPLRLSYEYARRRLRVPRSGDAGPTKRVGSISPYVALALSCVPFVGFGLALAFG